MFLSFKEKGADVTNEVEGTCKGRAGLKHVTKTTNCIWHNRRQNECLVFWDKFLSKTYQYSNVVKEILL